MKKIIFFSIAILLSSISAFAADYEMSISAVGTTGSGTITITFRNNTGASVNVTALSANIAANPSATLTVGSGVSTNGAGRFAKVAAVDVAAGGSTSFTVNFSAAAAGTTIFTMSNIYAEVDGLDGTTTVPPGSNTTNVITLPLDLLSFQAQTTGKNNLLKWQTANEVNTQSFDIERSTNGKNFEKVGNVKSAGTAKGSYQFTDDVPLSGINYYRLKMMDIDGSFTYSPVRSVVLGEGKATNVSIAPNPAKGQVFVKLNADDAKAITLVLVDVTGKTVLTERKNLESGFNQLPLNVSNYPQGLYFLKIVDANTTETHRLVIGN